MFIKNDTTTNTKTLMTKIQSDTEEEKRMSQEDVRLCREIKQMNQQNQSVQRSGNKDRIRKFNELFFNKIERLTHIRRNKNVTDKRELSRLVDEWKKKNYVF